MKKAHDSVLKQIAGLKDLSHDELCQLWKTLYGKDPVSSNRPHLVKQLAYRIQELAHGGLSENAHRMMDEILDTNGFDENGGNQATRRTEKKRKAGMPVVGTRLVREWNGATYEVIVVHGGFEYEGKRYRSLTAITKVITGTHWNGRAFFGLKKTYERKGGSAR